MVHDTVAREPGFADVCPVRPTSALGGLGSVLSGIDRNILDHLRREAASDGVTAADLGFLRTARVDDSDYWIWRFTDSSGAECFVTASINGTRSEIGFDENYDDLTPEQFILATERRWI